MEHIQVLLLVDLVVQSHAVRDLVSVLHQIQLGSQPGILLEVRAAHSEQLFDHVLRALLNLALLENVSERVEHLYTSRCISTPTVQALAALLAQVLSALLRHGHRDLHAVARRVLQQQEDELQHQQLARHLLVHQVRDEPSQRNGHQLVLTRLRLPHLVVALERASELEHHTLQQQLAHLGELRVHDGHQRRVHVREAGRGELRLHHRTAEEAAPADEVLLEEFGNDVADVGHVHLVDDAVQRLAQRLPRLALVLGRRLVVRVALQARQLERRNVDASRARRVGLRREQDRLRRGCRCRGCRRGSGLA